MSESDIQGCMNIEVKEILRDLLLRGLTDLDPQGQQARDYLQLMNQINELPTCNGEDEAGLGLGEVFSSGQNEYREFTGACMKQKKNMRECAAEWQKRKQA